MTSVLYRGKRKDDGQWVEGYYAKLHGWLYNEDIHVIIAKDCKLYPGNELDDWHEVIPETVCRQLDHASYDGLHGVGKLFQNDIIGVCRNRYEPIGAKNPESIAVVLDEHSITEGGFGRWFPQDTTRIRVLGNAYDNPELLEGHAMNHFVNRLREYPGTTDEYSEQHRYITDVYGIHGAHTGCYLCNFENDYICHQYNGGCDRIDVCRKIREQEGV